MSSTHQQHNFFQMMPFNLFKTIFIISLLIHSIQSASNIKTQNVNIPIDSSSNRDQKGSKVTFQTIRNRDS